MAAIPERGPFIIPWLRDLFLVALAVLLLAALAQISFDVPFSTGRSGEIVPITGQTFGVLLIGVTLGSRRSVPTIFAYLATGGLGAPFFAGGASGLSALFTGATAGYLWGFIPAVLFAGWLTERGLDRGPWLLAGMALSNALIYVVGLPVLALWLENNSVDVSVWDAGLWPFIPGDLAKLTAAAVAVPAAWTAVERFGPRTSRAWHD